MAAAAVSTLETSYPEDSSVHSSLPLDVKIIKIIKSCPNYTIRPARLATELSISLDDACAELCALLAAVGGGVDGASFTFEESPRQVSEEGSNGESVSQQPLPPIMVFTFPPDFEQRAWQYRRKEDARHALLSLAHFLVKAIQILTALGLILSLSIVTVAAMVGFFVAAFLLLSRGGDGSDGPRLTLVRQIRWWWSAVRQFLWCYALLGPGDQHNALLRDIAMDIAMFGSLCNPSNIWFWFRVRHWCQRRQQYQLHRGWRIGAPSTPESTPTAESTEGVRLLQQGPSPPWTGNTEVQYRGLLSVAVEFLFGPAPFSPGPDEAERWKLRAAVIIERSSASQGAGLSLQELVPYVDTPPTSIQDISGVVSSTLPIVSHFHGIPARTNGTHEDEATNNAKAKFLFNELVAETEMVGTQLLAHCYDDDDDDGTLESLFFITEQTSTRGELPMSSPSTSIPAYLQERRYHFTKLQMNQFFLCCCLLIGNLLGVMWLQQSLQPGGLLSSRRPTLLFRGFQRILVPLLYDYAIVFIVLPFLRLGVVMVANSFVAQRNERRSALAASLRAGRSNDDDMRHHTESIN